MIYTISYTLNPKRDTTTLIAEIQKVPRWMHYMDDTWLIATTESALAVWNRLAPYLQITDRVLIAEFPVNAAYQGWLPKEAWDWIKLSRSLYG